MTRDENRARERTAHASESADDGDPKKRRSSSRRFFDLRNWRVRRRLFAVVLIPVVAAVALGGLRIASSWDAARDYERVGQLAELGERVTALANELQLERDMVAGYIAQGRPGSESGGSGGHARIDEQQTSTDRALAALRAQAKVIDGSYSPILREKLTTAEDRLRNLFPIRFASLQTQLPVTGAIDAYSAVIADLLDINVEIAQSSGDSELEERVRALTALSRVKEQTSQQRALLYAALEGQGLWQGLQENFLRANASQQSALDEFASTATVERQQVYEDTVTGPEVDQAARLEARALVDTGNNDLSLSAEDWFTSMGVKLNQIRQVEVDLVRDIQDRSQALQSEARIEALRDAGVVLLVILLAMMIALAVARSMSRPLQTLRSSALDVAETRLPDVVRTLHDSDGRNVDLSVEGTTIQSSDEIGQVARAFDQVHEEAVRLASEQAALRGNVNAMFVNLSRRSQGLVERQLGLIDDLENGEQDAEQLSSLFKLDHLATRMRRHGENLLVLAGEEPGRRWGQPVPLLDVLRAAVSEVEQYERIELRSPLPGTQIVGRAVNDLVHLLAELLENASSYSSRDTAVVVSGQLLADGRVMLEISDSGIGMSQDELAGVNDRLSTQPVVDVSVSRRMGLFVVGRLAWRHGIRVQLRTSDGGGVSALVMLAEDITAAGEEGPGTGQIPVGGSSTAGAAGPAPTPQEQPVDTATGFHGSPTEPPPEDPWNAPAPAHTSASGYGEQSPPQSAPSIGVPASPAPSAPPAWDQPAQPQEPQAPGNTEPHLPPQPQPQAESAWGAAYSAQTPPGSHYTPSHSEPAHGDQPGSAGQGRPDSSTSPFQQTPARPYTGSATGPIRSSDSGSTWSSESSGGSVFAGSDYGMGEERRQALPIFDSIQSEWFRSRASRNRGYPAGGGETGAEAGQGTPRAGQWPAVSQQPQQPQQGQVPASAQPVQASSGPYEPQQTQEEQPPQQAQPQSHSTVSHQAQQQPEPDNRSWSSPGDEAWRTAEKTISTPASSGTTSAGLPKRTPGNNFVPGSAGASTGSATGTGSGAPTRSAPIRTPEAVGGRLANYHRGIRQGRDASREDQSSEYEREQENA